MKITRAIDSGVLTWVLIFASFALMSLVPGIKDSELQQNLLLYILLVPIVILGARYYYKKGRANGFVLGMVMSLVGLILDALITVPYVMLPKGSTYFDFFVNPFLLMTTVEFIVIVYFFWRKKIVRDERK